MKAKRGLRDCLALPGNPQRVETLGAHKAGELRGAALLTARPSPLRPQPPSLPASPMGSLSSPGALLGPQTDSGSQQPPASPVSAAPVSLGAAQPQRGRTERGSDGTTAPRTLRELSPTNPRSSPKGCSAQPCLPLPFLPHHLPPSGSGHSAHRPAAATPRRETDIGDSVTAPRPIRRPQPRAHLFHVLHGEVEALRRRRRRLRPPLHGCGSGRRAAALPASLRPSVRPSRRSAPPRSPPRRTARRER